MEILVGSSWRSWLPPQCLLVKNYCLLVENLSFRPVSIITIGLIAFFSHRTCCDVFVVFWIYHLWPISIGGADITVGLCCGRYNQTSLIYKKILWRFVFFVFVIGLVMTFIGRLLYCCYFCCRNYGWSSIVSYFIMNFVCRNYDQTSSWSSSWRTRFIDQVFRPIFLLLPLHHMLQQPTAARLLWGSYRIMLRVRYNRSIVSCEALALLELITSVY